MANFSTRLAYPPSAGRPARAAAPTGTGIGARLRRVLHALLRSIDEAPFDLAWPPSHRRWPANVPAWRDDQGGDAERAELRRAARGVRWTSAR